MPGKQRQERTAMSLSNLDVPEDCRAVSEVLDRVGDKWSVLVVVTLGDGPKRFNELRRSIASISQRMLTLTLRGLERGRPCHAYGVSHDPTTRRLRADRARPLAPAARRCAWQLGAREPGQNSAGQAAVRRQETAAILVGHCQPPSWTGSSSDKPAPGR